MFNLKESVNLMHMFQLEYSDGKKEYLSHDFFLSLDIQAKVKKLAPLKKLYTNKALNINCCCSKSRPKMLIIYMSKTGNYAIKSLPGEVVKHENTCAFGNPYISDFNLSTNTSNVKGYVEKDGKITVNLNSLDFQNPNLPNESIQKGTTTPESSNSIAATKSTSKASLNGLTRRLLTEAWNDSIKRSTKGYTPYPTDDKKTIYDRLTSNILKKYVVGKNSLKEIFYAGESTGKVSIIEKNTGATAFTILLHENKLESPIEENLTITLRNPFKKDFCEVIVDRLSYNTALTAIKNIEGPYLAGGFLINTGYRRPPQFISFCLVPISHYGAPIESSFERQLYNELSSEERKVLRPLRERLPAAWNGFTPDGLLIDTKPWTILEVFGMSKVNEDYHRHRDIKIEHFSSLNPNYNFWKWDAYNNKNIPPLP